jgi:hypothetical protein
MLRGIEAQRHREGHTLGEALGRDLDRGCVVYSLERDAGQVCHLEGEEVVPDDEYTREQDESECLQKHSPQRYWDAITCEELPADLTAAARAEELAFMKVGACGTWYPSQNSEAVQARGRYRASGWM